MNIQLKAVILLLSLILLLFSPGCTSSSESDLEEFPQITLNPTFLKKDNPNDVCIQWPYVTTPKGDTLFVQKMTVTITLQKDGTFSLDTIIISNPR